MNNQWVIINQLDRQLKDWQAVSKKYGKPRAGWIKTLRAALSMSAEQFADRLGLTRGRVNQLENAETHDAITLRTLKEAANALGCELVYAIVPKNNSSLEDIIRSRAEQIAKERVTRVAHTMSLEAQSVDADTLKIQKSELAKSIMEHLNKRLWSTPDSLAEAIYMQMKRDHEIAIPPKKELKNNPVFIEKLKEYLTKLNNNKNIHEDNLTNKLNDPMYINALKNALIRYQINYEKQNKQEKLIENLKKKK
jgi:predicted DNA-binding mobile mystery protein A